MTAFHRLALWLQAEKVTATLKMAVKNKTLPAFIESAEKIMWLSRLLQGSGMSWSLKVLLMDVISSHEGMDEDPADDAKFVGEDSSTTLGMVVDAITDGYKPEDVTFDAAAVSKELAELIEKNGIASDAAHFCTLDDWDRYNGDDTVDIRIEDVLG